MPENPDDGFREKLLEAIRDDSRVRGEVERLVLESAVMQELKTLREDMNSRFEAVDRRFEQQARELAALREDMNKRFEAVDRRFEALLQRMDEGFRRMDDRFSALGSRWGIQTEEAVRHFAQEFICAEFGMQAERWTHDDVELDVVVHNGKHFLIAIASSCNKKRVERFLKGVRVYQQQSGCLPARKLVVTAHATGEAWKLALSEGVEIISG